MSESTSYKRKNNSISGLDSESGDNTSSDSYEPAAKRSSLINPALAPLQLNPYSTMKTANNNNSNNNGQAPRSTTTTTTTNNNNMSSNNNNNTTSNGSNNKITLADRKQKAKEELKIAVICSSNMNRSMEAHAFLAKKGYNVESFGTGDKVKLPGSAPDKPNVYEFGTTYDFIYQDLLTKDKNMYTQNGLLHMLDRNRRIKAKPQKFQLSPSRFHLIITCEERVYDQAMEHLDTAIYKGIWTPKNEALHLVNIDIQDNHEEATIGAFLITELVQMLSSAEDLDNEIDELLLEFESNHDRNLLHSILWQ